MVLHVQKIMAILIYNLQPYVTRNLNLSVKHLQKLRFKESEKNVYSHGKLFNYTISKRLRNIIIENRYKVGLGYGTNLENV